ncbi:EamA family transporter [Staphylococcus saprophyticus]
MFVIKLYFKATIINILIFTLFGMILNQYSYMLSIFHGNAAIATMLEYMSPIYVIIWLVLRKKDKLKILDTLSLIILIFSLFLLLTNGDIKTLKVSDQSLFWGIISGVSLAFYTIYSKKLLIKFPSLLIIGWSMIIGGLLMNIKFPIWDINLKEIQITNIILILLNILTGTALAYWLYIKSVEYINEKKTIIFSTIEPIIAITSSVFIMHISFEKYQTIGIILILISITQLSLKK